MTDVRRQSKQLSERAALMRRAIFQESLTWSWRGNEQNQFEDGRRDDALIMDLAIKTTIMPSDNTTQRRSHTQKMLVEGGKKVQVLVFLGGLLCLVYCTFISFYTAATRTAPAMT